MHLLHFQHDHWVIPMVRGPQSLSRCRNEATSSLKALWITKLVPFFSGLFDSSPDAIITSILTLTLELRWPSTGILSSHKTTKSASPLEVFKKVVSVEVVSCSKNGCSMEIKSFYVLWTSELVIVLVTGFFNFDER